MPMNPLEIWRRRLLRREIPGEDPAKPKTWVLDETWRAACKEMARQEAGFDKDTRVPPPQRPEPDEWQPSCSDP